MVTSGATPGLAQLEVVRPLPTMLGAEDSAQVLHAGVQRTRSLRTAPFVGVVWKAEEVVVLVGLPPELGRVGVVAVHRAESPRAIRVEIQLGLVAGDHLGDRAPDPSGASKSIEREASRHEETAKAGDRPSQRPR